MPKIKEKKMKLNIETLKKISRGAVRIEERDGYICFLRFTKAQEELYKGVKTDFYNKTFSCAGVMLDFVTNSKTLTMKGSLTPSSSRTYYSFDIFIDGKPAHYIDNFTGVAVEKCYAPQKFEITGLDTHVDLGEGEKRVTVYFPWSMAVRFTEISLDDGALVEPCESKKKLLAFGDSITHGYDAMRPSVHYVQRLCEALGYEQVNKGIGAEIYRPALARLAEDFTPDLITVAYGTNDWNLIKSDEFTKNCSEFLKALRANYKDTKIIVLSPIWRKNVDETKPFGSFFDVEKIQREIVADIENTAVISGFDLVPHSPDYFADLRLHPNDAGFEHYFNNLVKKVKEIV